MERSVAISAVFMMGCLPGPPGPRNGAVPTGERVAVVDDVKQWTTTYREKVGDSEVKNANGEVIYTKEDYQDRTQLHSKKVWYPVQGRNQITDEDFFRLTGDGESLRLSAELRHRGRVYTALGTGAMVLGIAATIAARFVDDQKLQIGLYSGGGIAGLAGGYAFLRGWEMQSPDEHAIDRSIADIDAQRYNAKLRRGASLTILQGRF
jgi:hypothetical protein